MKEKGTKLGIGELFLEYREGGKGSRTTSEIKEKVFNDYKQRDRWLRRNRSRITIERIYAVNI
jgi:hypothetical protein